MNLQQLEYITALDKFRHFGKAADYCQVTQPTLSTMIQKLEDELGVRLFDRTRQHIEPTAVGRKIVAQAEEIIRQSSLIHEIILNERDQLRGEITIAILPTIAPFLLPRIIPQLEKALPNLNVCFTEMLTSECILSLQQSKIDMAIIASSMNSSQVREEKLFFEEFLGYVAETEELYHKPAIRSSEVDSKHLWLLDEGHCFRDQLVRFCQLTRKASRRFTYKRGSLETFMHLVEMGYGMTFVPELFLDLASPQQKEHIRPFMIPRPTRTITMCVRKDFIREHILSEIVQIIKGAVPPHMLELKVGQNEV